jgi:aryl-alcohol dehydrogenase-like predicted oxidoreductase
METLAKKHDATVAQLSLAWLLQRSPVMIPIAGTSSVKHLEENVKARDLTLSADEWRELEAAAK